MPGNDEIKKTLDQLAFTLDEIAPGGKTEPPSEMITSVGSSLHDYAKANFSNSSCARGSESTGGVRAPSRCNDFCRSSL